MSYSGTQRPNCWNAAGDTEAGYCCNVFWGLTSMVSDVVGHAGKELV